MKTSGHNGVETAGSKGSRYLFSELGRTLVSFVAFVSLVSFVFDVRGNALIA